MLGQQPQITGQCARRSTTEMQVHSPFTDRGQLKDRYLLVRQVSPVFVIGGGLQRLRSGHGLQVEETQQAGSGMKQQMAQREPGVSSVEWDYFHSMLLCESRIYFGQTRGEC